MKKRILFLFGVIVVAVLAIFACACFAPSMSASAELSPTDSVVNDNLLNISSKEYGLGNYTTYTYNGYSRVSTFYQDNVYVWSTGGVDLHFNEIIPSNSTSLWGFYYSIVFDEIPSTSLTFTASFSSEGNRRLRIYNPSDASNIYSNWFTTDGIYSLTFTPSSLNYYLFIQFYGPCTFNWWKLEEGSSFTGYVPSKQAVLRKQLNYTQGYVNSNKYLYFADDIFINSSIVDDSVTIGSDFELTAINSNGFSFSSSGLVASVNNTTFLNFGRSNWVYDLSNSQYVTIAFDAYYSSPVSTTFIFTINLGGVNYSHVCQSGLNVFSFYNESGFDSFSTWSFSFPSFSSYTNVRFIRFKVERGPYFTNFPYSDSSILDAYNVGYDIGYGAGLDVGLNDGLIQGYEEGLYDGRGEGYTDGFRVGDSEGYSRGLETARNGNWWNVMTALVNVPVKAIIGFFDIEILGFNVLNLFRTIILISLFIFVVNLLLKKLL